MTLAVDCVNFALLLICSQVFYFAVGLSAQYYKVGDNRSLITIYNSRGCTRHNFADRTKGSRINVSLRALTWMLQAQLDAHLKLHNEKWTTEDVRKCKLCNKQFSQPALYRLHIREHYRVGSLLLIYQIIIVIILFILFFNY